MDWVEPTVNGNRYILIFVAYFTKYTEAFALFHITAEIVAKRFLTGIICRYGAPKILHSDRGTSFTASLMQEITRLCKTKQVFITPYHPMANGLVQTVMIHLHTHT